MALFPYFTGIIHRQFEHVAYMHGEKAIQTVPLLLLRFYVATSTRENVWHCEKSAREKIAHEVI